MTDHDHHEPEEDTTMAADATAVHPRPRRADRTTGTRLDPHGLYDVADPTVRVTPAPPVSPIGVHTRGAAATTPPDWRDPAMRDAAVVLDKLLDDRARIEADTKRAWTGRPVFRVRRGKARTVREVAARRAAAKLRHERHMEVIETVKAYIAVLTLIALFLLVVGMAAVSFAILAGWMVWAPTRV